MYETPKAETVEQFARTLQLDLPPVASALAAKQACGGDVRKAEVLLWKVWERIGGGTPGERPNAGSGQARGVLEIIRELVFPGTTVVPA